MPRQHTISLPDPIMTRLEEVASGLGLTVRQVVAMLLASGLGMLPVPISVQDQSGPVPKKVLERYKSGTLGQTAPDGPSRAHALREENTSPGTSLDTDPGPDPGPSVDSAQGIHATRAKALVASPLGDLSPAGLSGLSFDQGADLIPAGEDCQQEALFDAADRCITSAVKTLIWGVDRGQRRRLIVFAESLNVPPDSLRRWLETESAWDWLKGRWIAEGHVPSTWEALSAIQNSIRSRHVDRIRAMPPAEELAENTLASQRALAEHNLLEADARGSDLPPAHALLTELLMPTREELLSTL